MGCSRAATAATFLCTPETQSSSSVLLSDSGGSINLIESSVTSEIACCVNSTPARQSNNVRICRQLVIERSTLAKYVLQLIGKRPAQDLAPALLNTHPGDRYDVKSINRKRFVCIVIFDEVEVLDFCGPFEVFTVTGGRQGLTPFEVCTVAEENRAVKARGGLSVNPTYSFENCPPPDILLIPGGIGTRREMNNSGMLQWLGRHAGGAELILSVCSGALVLAKAGLLNGLSATTHHGALDELRAIDPDIAVDSEKRFIDNGRVIVSAGISAGIDMSLHVVARLLGQEQALETARYMEYEGWQN